MLVQSLHGKWNIHSTDNKFSLETQIPGTLMNALEEQKYFGEKGIFWKKNNRKAREVANRDFVFRNSFTLDSTLLSQEKIFLECDGLDTLAEIVINGISLAKTANMHRRYRFLVENLIEGENIIEIFFANTISYVEKKQKKRYLIHAYHDMPDTAQLGFNHIRKSHCSYGWDWGPIVPDVGIWRDIRLVGYSKGHLDHIQIRQEHHSQRVDICCNPRMDAWSTEDLQWQLEVTAPDGIVTSVSGDIGEPLKCSIQHPELWWPRGLGKQPLYSLTFRLLWGSEILEEVERQIGLRIMDVNREFDQWGQNFNLRCNGQDFFAMGADYIPEDLFLTTVTPQRTRHLLEEAARANFNCIRVWGGGVYPDKNFYQICDELGLVVWQDFMFACAIYDVRDPEFQENIRQEAIDIAERLHHHASLGLLCGNNEMEVAFVDWQDFADQAKREPEIKEEYLLQYESLLKDISKTQAPDVFYWPASPSSGGGFEEPNAPEKGDCHFWDVWHSYHPYEEYEQHYFRFMSEFGFESFPHWKTVQSFSEESDHQLFSDVMEDHQRGHEGNKKLKHYLDKYFQIPKDFRSLVYLSQVSQAEAIRHGVEHWRRNRGRCMGAVYWQFNDNWPVISWSSVDYYGRWKALHYQAKRDFDALLLTCKREEKTIELHLSNESRDREEGEVVWQLLSLEGKLLNKGSESVWVDPFSSRMVSKVDLTNILADHPLDELALSFQFRQNGKILRSELDHFVDFKELKLENPQLEWTMIEENGSYILDVQAHCPAFFVEIDLGIGEGRLSDNFFQLNGIDGKRIEITDCSITLDQLKEQLTMMSLFDSYQ